MNETFKVGALFDCNKLEYYELDTSPMYYYFWRQSLVGCKVLQVLQEMYLFNVTYVFEERTDNLSGSPQYNTPVDIYLRPMALWSGGNEDTVPIHVIFMWRFGFMFRQLDSGVFRLFYTLPFNLNVWRCLVTMFCIFTLLSFFTYKVEKKISATDEESSLAYEMLVVIAAHCQQSLPMKTRWMARRTMYLVLFLFAYIIYSFYTSNLLSHLVTENSVNMDLEDLAASDYECAEVESMQVKFITYWIPKVMDEKLTDARVMSMSDGLDAMRRGKVALLSDYISLYPAIKRSFLMNEMCELVEVDLFSDVKKYLFTARDFPYIEQFKIGTQRAQEVGLFKRLFAEPTFHDIQCEVSPHIPNRYVFNAILLLFAMYALAVLILLFERHLYNSYELWPYVN
nr:ionotropic receptor 2 [Achelura yunnanensis]